MKFAAAIGKPQSFPGYSAASTGRKSFSRLDWFQVFCCAHVSPCSDRLRDRNLKNPAEAGPRHGRIGGNFESSQGRVQKVQDQASASNLFFQLRNLSYVGRVRRACRGLECQDPVRLVFCRQSQSTCNLDLTNRTVTNLAWCSFIRTLFGSLSCLVQPTNLYLVPPF